MAEVCRGRERERGRSRDSRRDGGATRSGLEVAYSSGQAGLGPDSRLTVRMRRMVWTLWICLWFGIGAGAQALPGRQQNPTPPAPRMDPISPSGETTQAQEEQAREMAKKANLARQAALKSDTDKLLKLAEELKTSVDKSSANVLSLDVLKKAEEIEKLAHSVRDKMKGTN